MRGPTRRGFLAGLAGLAGLLAGGSLGAGVAMVRERPAAIAVDRRRVRALLVSSTTVAGKASLEHAASELRALYADASRLLLINFASLPEDRDAYAERMQRDFGRLAPHLEVASLHALAPERAARAVREAEAFFVSGGNTFLLLRELCDREALGVLRERVLAGAPYAGSSAGSNLAGLVIGTTNDFPLVDVPSRRALGLLPAVYNPHHPEEAEAEAFGSRQWKIRQYARYHPAEPVVGVNNAGMIAIRGDALELRGEGAMATVQVGSEGAIVRGDAESDLAAVIARLRPPERVLKG